MEAYLISYVDSCKKYKLKAVSHISYNANTNPMVISLPEMDQPMVFNFSGRVNKVTVAFKAVPDTDDLSDGTNTLDFTQLYNHIDYLKTYFVSADIMATVGVIVLDDSGNVVIQSFGIPAGLRWSWIGGQMALSVEVSFIENMMLDDLSNTGCLPSDTSTS